MTPNEEPLRPFFDNALSPNHCLKVFPSLLVQGFDNIFAIGDIVDLKIPKLAANIRKQKKVIERNLEALVFGKEPLCKLKSSKLQEVSLVSIGPSNAIMVVPISKSMVSFVSNSLVSHFKTNMFISETKLASEAAKGTDKLLDRIHEVLPMLELYLAPHIIASILNYIEPPLLSFPLLTCSSWYNIISKFHKPTLFGPMLKAKCAAFHGHLSLMQHIIQDNQIPKEDYLIIFNSASGGGQIKILEYFISKFPSDFDVSRVSAAPAIQAANYGQLSTLIFLHERGYVWDSEACYYAASNGHLHCLEYLHSNGCIWFSDTLSIAAENGHLGCLKYALDNGCLGDELVCGNAASRGHLDCLKYAHESGCWWNVNTTQNAAVGGHLECLKYAHENGCPWDQNACIYAASRGHLGCLVYLHENGCQWSSETLECAAEYGQMDCLKYAMENGCPKSNRILTKAASGGHLEALKYAHQNGCEWHLQGCSSAAYNGYLDCLKYAHENGCVWGATCDVAAAGLQLDCLKYAYENGAKLSQEVYSKLTNLMHYECVLKSIREERLTCEKMEGEQYICNKAIECFQYVRSSGIEWNIKKSVNLHTGRRSDVKYDPIQEEYLWEAGKDTNFFTFISNAHNGIK